MTDQTGGDQPQKTVAELLAQHGQQVDGGRRRRRRAAEDEEEAPETGPRRSRMTDTAPQAIIDRVTADGGTPPPPSRGGRRRPEGSRPAPQESGVHPRPVNGQQESGAYPRPSVPGPPQSEPRSRPAPQPEAGRPPHPPMESGQYPRPPAGPQESGGYPRPPAPQESGYVRPPAGPQESGGYPRPPAPQESGYVRPPETGQFPPAPQESGQLPVPPRRPHPPAASAEETQNQLSPVRRPAPPNGALSSRLDGAPEAEAPEQPMASGAFPTPAPQRPRRAPARRPAPKSEPHTEQFDAVTGPPPEAEAAPAEEARPSGLAGWRKRRQQEQLEDTEVGVMPVVPPAAPEEGYADEDYVDDEGYPIEGDEAYTAEDGYPAEADDYDAGPPTAGYPAPMPFAPGGKDEQLDDLSEYEAEFADSAYAEGSPDFESDDGYAYDEEYEDEEARGEAAAEEPAAEAEAVSTASPGKQWLTLAGQLALGVIGGAGVWLGFNWLWVNLAPAALVGALLVIVALVWIVRKIRRAEDLQTTLLAILVGLVVTVSPAALLLVAK
ncbi:hypothetical protein ATK36_2868 [Amycolatopsis sulphurea]|uniref:Uncharacterized protein n=1 Tax=Amycolatopsis sulphurea TaxID=76022 RepID=A0A2A9F8Y7_9PSEU|nr:hypothetical protein [Amycolatopsis sulphurea]PFG47814.1 hypothetical protein ATK36_2868 [Amycolatopsis sulphurea]